LTFIIYIFYSLRLLGCAGQEYNPYDGPYYHIARTYTCSDTTVQAVWRFLPRKCDTPPDYANGDSISLLGTPGVCTTYDTDSHAMHKCLPGSNPRPTSAPSVLQTWTPNSPKYTFFTYIDRISGVKAGYALNACIDFPLQGDSYMYRESPNLLANFYGPGLDAIEVSKTKYFRQGCLVGYGGLGYGGPLNAEYKVRYPVSAATAEAAGLREFAEYTVGYPTDGGATGGLLYKYALIVIT
jgi:hypothetical protein